MTTSEIKKMTVAERLKMMEDIWDTLCHEDEAIESPPWHEGILISDIESLKFQPASIASVSAIIGCFPNVSPMQYITK